ncbi:MAG: hypothetical protein K2O34_08060, partial [Acetatifactor sp.]|nr:hypothetical protein [Acetatifactor sp.]
HLVGGWDMRAGQELVSQCPYLELDEVPQYAPGILLDMQNGDVDGSWLPKEALYHANEVVFTGKLIGSQFVEPRIPDGARGYYKLCFEVCSVEAAYEEYMVEGKTVYVCSMPGIEGEIGNRTEAYYPEQQDERFMEEYEKLEEGKTYLIYGFYYEWSGVNGTFGAQKGSAGLNFVLLPLPSDGVYFHEVAGAVDYDTPELAGLSDYVDYLCHNQSSMEITEVRDMSRLPIFQESVRQRYITEGRILTREDELQGNRVCVVHENFARLRGLQVGDVLRLDLVKRDADVEDLVGYAYWKDWESWKNFDTQEMEFEIVGLWNDLNLVYTSVNSATVYVPQASLPEGFGKEDLENRGSAGYSFVLQNPGDQERFMEEYEERLLRLGYTVEFMDNNGEGFLQAAEELRESARFGMLLFGAVLAVVLPACCALYLIQRRKEYVVARALGVPAGRAAGALAVSFGWVAVPGVLAGCCLGWRRMLGSAGELLAPLENQVKTEKEVSLPAGWLLVMILGILAAVYLILALGGLILSGKPVLSLLQGSVAGGKTTARGKTMQRKTEERAAAKVLEPKEGAASGVAREAGAASMAVPLSIPQGGHSMAPVMLRYTGKHILRTKMRSALPLVMGIGAVLLFGWMSRTMTDYEQEVERLYLTTVVEGELRKTDLNSDSPSRGGGQIAPELVRKVEKSGLVAKTYWEETALAHDVSFPGKAKEPILTYVPLLGIYDKEGFFEGTGEALEVQFYGGYNWDYFLRERDAMADKMQEIILPEQYFREFDLAMGDMLNVACERSNGGAMGISCMIVGFYRENSEASNITSVGVGNRIIMHAQTLQDLAGTDFNYLVAQFQFIPEKNRELLEREEELKSMVSDAESYMRMFIWDEELHEVVEPLERTLSLFHILYPVAAVVALALGLGFQLLLLLQRRREAAVMRILGNKAGTVGRLLGAEQLLMCLTGTGLGVLLGILRYGALAGNVWLASGLYVLGSLAGIVAGSMAVSRRSPLDMLQEKE